VVVTGAAVDYLYHLWHRREASPVGWPGYNKDTPNLPDGWEHETMPDGSLTGDFIKHNPDGSTERLHPDLDHPTEGSHWDYGEYDRPGQNNRAGHIYPNENNTGGYIVWNK